MYFEYPNKLFGKIWQLRSSYCFVYFSSYYVDKKISTFQRFLVEAKPLMYFICTEVLTLSEGLFLSLNFAPTLVFLINVQVRLFIFRKSSGLHVFIIWNYYKIFLKNSFKTTLNDRFCSLLDFGHFNLIMPHHYG